MPPSCRWFAADGSIDVKFLAILLFLPLLARAADPSQPSDAILKLRGQPQGELQVTYKKSIGGKDQAIGMTASLEGVRDPLDAHVVSRK